MSPEFSTDRGTTPFRILLFLAVALAIGAAGLYTLRSGQRRQSAAMAPDRPDAPAVALPTPAEIVPATTAPATPPARPEPAVKTEPAPPTGPAPAPAPSTATLRIESDVPGASVFIDRVYLGTTPITVPNVTPGSHRLNASADGQEGIAETIDVVAGPRDIMLRFKEIRLDVRVDVVHKHGVGSCAGTLSASPKGVRYVTTHKDDGFDVPLAGIDTLDLDYLAKNLRLRLKSGKTYNFKETSGGADQLYAFHRDVDKTLKKKGR